MVLLHLVALLIGGLAAPDAEAPGLPRDALVPRAVMSGGGGQGSAGQLAPTVDSGGVAVIVHEGTGPEDLGAAQIRRIFLLRQRFWSDGAPVAPVNLPAASALREEFSRLVLGQSTRDLAEYWKDLYFHGTQPPPVLDSEEAVLLYVSRTDGAIGYVSLSFLSGVSLPPGVRVVRVWDSGEGGGAPTP